MGEANKNRFSEIQELLRQRADLQARLRLLPYDGSPEVKEKNGRRYLYVRRRVAGKLTSEYAGVWSEELHRLLEGCAKEARALRREIRRADRRLAELGHTAGGISPEVALNLEFARANMKTSIYGQAVVEGVGATFPQTEAIIEAGIVHGVAAPDVQKILNLKHAWEFILDEDVLSCASDFNILRHIAKLVNEGFLADGGRLRGVPVTIGGCSYVPPIPIEADARDRLREILGVEREPIDTAAELCARVMKAQLFGDGNKRAAVIFASHYLLSRAAGFISIPEEAADEFKRRLVEFYDGDEIEGIAGFIRKRCWRRMGE